MRTLTAVAARAVGATKVYGSGVTAVRALDGVDVEFAEGRFTAILGASGSGKSTLMHCVAGLDRLSSGQASLGCVELGSLSDGELAFLRREQVAFVFQSFNLVPTLTVGENITLPLLLARKRPDPVLLEAVVDQVRLGDCVTRRPWELSGGQQQRVALARALVSRPRIVFADEPAGNLGCRSGAELLWAFRQAVRELGQTVVMATRDPAVAAAADSVLFLSHGRLAGQMMHPTLAEILDQIGC
ncbi:MAG: putative transport system ATP-binding protein [Actinomycetota bacterium]|nr:putative transport system ATP-binding protein [Actinomycetota bacterium]